MALFNRWKPGAEMPDAGWVRETFRVAPARLAVVGGCLAGRTSLKSPRLTGGFGEREGQAESTKPT